MKTYIGNIENLGEKEIFVFGSNPEGRHGAGSAKIARQKFGAVYGKGRGLQGRSYALVTKNITPHFTEEGTGVLYKKSGNKSVTSQQIIENISELYDLALKMPDHTFWVAYRLGGRNLNGYTDREMAAMFSWAGNAREKIPENLGFEEGFWSLIQETYGKH